VSAHSTSQTVRSSASTREILGKINAAQVRKAITQDCPVRHGSARYRMCKTNLNNPLPNPSSARYGFDRRSPQLWRTARLVAPQHGLRDRGWLVHVDFTATWPRACRATLYEFGMLVRMRLADPRSPSGEDRFIWGSGTVSTILVGLSVVWPCRLTRSRRSTPESCDWRTSKDASTPSNRAQ
jgi:hypothetical protein